MKNNPLESQDAYQKYVDVKTPNSPILKNCFNSFLFGGIICALGQLIFEYCIFRNLNETISYSIVSISLIFLSIFLTALNLFNKIGKIAGARNNSTYYWFRQFYSITCNGIQIRRIYYGSWK